MTWHIDEDRNGAIDTEHEMDSFFYSDGGIVGEVTKDGFSDLVEQLDNGMRFEEIRQELIRLVGIHEKIISKEMEDEGKPPPMVSNNMGLIKGVLDLFDAPRGPHMTQPRYAIEANLKRSRGE